MAKSTPIRAILAAVLLFSLALVVQCQSPITCEAGYYQKGEKARVTCHFHGDISMDKNTGAYITRHNLTASTASSGQEVLMCHFSGDNPAVCDPEEGYRFLTFHKGHNLTIEIPDVSVDFKGRYSCGVIPHDERKSLSCLLIVETSHSVHGLPGHDILSTDHSEKHADTHGHVQAVLVILILLLVGLVAGGVVYVLYARKTGRFPFKKATTKLKDDENAESSAAMLPEKESMGPPTVFYKQGVQDSVDMSVSNTSSHNSNPPLPVRNESYSNPSVENRHPPSTISDKVDRPSLNPEVHVSRPVESRKEKERDEIEEEKEPPREETKKERKEREKKEKKAEKARKEAEKKEQEAEQKRLKKEQDEAKKKEKKEKREGKERLEREKKEKGAK